MGITSLERSAAATDIPTVAESRFPGFEAVTWIGTVAPAGLVQPIVKRLNSEIVRIMRLPEVRERLTGLGAEPLTNTPEDFAAYIKTEIGKWAKVVKASGAVAE